MTESFITLAKNSAQFQSYLSGSFSSDFRAIPVKSLNVNTPNEKVTFELVAKDKIKTKWLQLVGKGLRLELFPLFLSPLLLVLVWALTKGMIVELWRVAFVFGSLLCLHSGVFLLNSFQDHMYGFDRVYRNGGNQLIQSGIMTAQWCGRLSVVFLGLGVLLSLPVVLASASSLLIIGVLAALVLFGFLFKWGQFRKYGLGELAIFIGFGGLLTYGIGLALTGAGHTELLVLGGLTGYLAVVSFLLKHFETIMSDHQLKKRTWAGLIGFDGAKIWISICLILVVPLVLGAHSILNISIEHLWVWIPSVTVSLYMLFRIKKISSPLSSSLQNLRYWGVLLHTLCCLSLGLAFAL